jgi:hypothetical protein
MVPPDAFTMNRSLVREGKFDPDIVARLVNKKVWFLHTLPFHLMLIAHMHRISPRITAPT